ncbi:MAG: tRNA (N6-threonylcarbamoyladenosine(37)-N6)-methyltransferase TrmO [Planctomycetota bacterium]
MALSKLAVVVLLGAVLAAKAHGGEAERQVYQLHPVGTVEKKGGATRLVIAEEYAPALEGLDGFSHVVVLYWFHKNDVPRKRRILQVHPRGNRTNPLTGVFACRAPVRPNPIALSVCRIQAVEGGVVRVDRIDAFDGTPILDLKPHIPAIDSPEDVRLPQWLGK